MATTPANRLLDALAEAFVEQGLAHTTVADIARIAGTSKRTFYEHFASKEDAFLALYAGRADALVAAISAVVTDPTAPIEEQVRGAVRAYLDHLADNPALVRAHMLEAHSLGRTGLDARRSLIDRHAAYLRGLVDEASRHHDDVRRLSTPESVAVVAGLIELTLRAVLDGRTLNSRSQVDHASSFILDIVRAG
ncbi:TetR family transcriptional regulator [Knoellia remsis]|uniref:TetR family transcriptional regulator n=1 Tax=Knoellia remsis TaxID=407159 RepID=A0A2T0UGE1_9MICO|nr:TetR/AcrR family transcriptional regulator [Knoellia remsis]PRY57015.1 TetR family transcriptional regulator [Knoellia remsis]